MGVGIGKAVLITAPTVPVITLVTVFNFAEAVTDMFACNVCEKRKGNNVKEKETGRRVFKDRLENSFLQQGKGATFLNNALSPPCPDKLRVVHTNSSVITTLDAIKGEGPRTALISIWHKVKGSVTDVHPNLFQAVSCCTR